MITLNEFKVKLWAGQCVLEIPKRSEDWADVSQMLEDITAETADGYVMSFPKYVNSRTYFKYAGFKPSSNKFNAAMLPSAVTGRITVQIVRHTQIEICNVQSVQITDTEFFDTLCG